MKPYMDSISTRARVVLLGCTVAIACNGDDTSATPGADTGSSSTTGTTSSTGVIDPDGGSTTGGTLPTDDTTTGQVATCEDEVQNQDESDVDCGGSVCAGCEVGQSCNDGADCLSLACDDGTCAAPSCSDGAKNGDETDVDCGGSCGPCGDNQACAGDEDCTSGTCLNDVCVPASCRDGIQNGSETDVDCGGPSCPGCSAGGGCDSADDCDSLFCVENSCVDVECLVNADCTHLAGTCAVGQCNQATNTCQATPAFQGAACNDGNNCTVSTCNGGLCSGPAINCAALNTPCAQGACDPAIGCYAEPLNEGATCSDGNACTTNTVCTAGSCGGGDAVDCSYLNTGCQVGSCNQANGQCQVQTLPNGAACDDGFPCSTNTTCQAGACVPDNLVPFWTEDFANNDAGWTLGPEWEIGPAQGSTCPNLGQDPGSDHTQAGDNGVAGVVIGGCATPVLHDWYCLTSPAVDTSVANGPLFLEFWRHLHSDWPDYMRNRIDVFDGTEWLNVWVTSGTGSIDDANWLRISHELSNFKNPDFQVRFCFNIEQVDWTVASWNIDDVHLLACP